MSGFMPNHPCREAPNCRIASSKLLQSTCRMYVLRCLSTGVCQRGAVRKLTKTTTSGHSGLDCCERGAGVNGVNIMYTECIVFERSLGTRSNCNVNLHGFVVRQTEAMRGTGVELRRPSSHSSLHTVRVRYSQRACSRDQIDPHPSVVVLRNLRPWV